MYCMDETHETQKQGPSFAKPHYLSVVTSHYVIHCTEPPRIAREGRSCTDGYKYLGTHEQELLHSDG